MKNFKVFYKYIEFKIIQMHNQYNNFGVLTITPDFSLFFLLS